MAKNILITDQFSDKRIGLELSVPYQKEDHVKLLFLGRLMGLSTKNYPTTQKLHIKCEELYNSYIKTERFVRGKSLVFRISISYLNLLNAEDENEVFKLLYDLVYNPNVSNNQWNELDFNEVLNKIKHKMKTYKDDPRRYATNEAMNLLAPNVGLTNIFANDESILDDINRASIYECYTEFINKVKVQCFAMGEYNDDIEDKLKNIFGTKMEPLDYQKLSLALNEQIIRKNDTFDGNQTIINMGFKFSDVTDFEMRYVAPFVDDLFGANTGICKLFNKIREERGLAYYVYSDRIDNTNLLRVSAGTKKESVEEVSRLVLESLNELQNGDFNEELILDLKKTYEASLKSIFDNKNSVFNRMVKEYNGMLEPIDQTINNYMKVTKEDIVNLSSKLHLATVYVLEGDK